MEYNEFKAAARRLAKAVHTTELASALSRQLGVDVQELINQADGKPIDFARAAEWLSQAIYGKSWNVVSAAYKNREKSLSIFEQWLDCQSEREALDFLLARSDLGGEHVVSETTGYREEPMDDGCGFPRTRVSVQLVFDKPGNPRGEYAIYVDGNNGGLVGWEALDEHGDYIHFEGADAFDVLLGKPHLNLKTFADQGLKVQDRKPNTTVYQAKQKMTDFCTDPVDEYAPMTFRVAGGEYLIQKDLVNQLPEILRKYRSSRASQGSLSSEADFNTGFMAAVLAILGQEAAMSPGLVLNSRL